MSCTNFITSINKFVHNFVCNFVSNLYANLGDVCKQNLYGGFGSDIRNHQTGDSKLIEFSDTASNIFKRFRGSGYKVVREYMSIISLKSLTGHPKL